MSLKSHQEWLHEWDSTGVDFDVLVQKIQANALRHAAEICRLRERTGFYDKVITDVADCVKALETEAQKLEEGKQ